MNPKQIYAMFSLSLLMFVWSLISYQDRILQGLGTSELRSCALYTVLVVILLVQSFVTHIMLKIWQASRTSQILFPILLVLTGVTALALRRSSSSSGNVAAAMFLIFQCLVLKVGKVKLLAKFNLIEPKR
jgi:hypothetical protein